MLQFTFAYVANKVLVRIKSTNLTSFQTWKTHTIAVEIRIFQIWKKQLLDTWNVRVKRTRPHAVDRLGWTTYRAAQRVYLLIHISYQCLKCGYVGADAASYPSLYCWRRLFHVSNQRKGERSPLQRPGVLTIVTSVSKGRVPMRSTGSVEQPIKLLSGLTYWFIYPINVWIVATLELTLHHIDPSINSHMLYPLALSLVATLELTLHIYCLINAHLIPISMHQCLSRDRYLQLYLYCDTAHSLTSVNILPSTAMVWVDRLSQVNLSVVSLYVCILQLKFNLKKLTKPWTVHFWFWPKPSLLSLNLTTLDVRL